MAEHHVVTVGISDLTTAEQATLSLECSCGAYMDTEWPDMTLAHLNNLVLNLEHRSTQED